jgi:hypothetical protein
MSEKKEPAQTMPARPTGVSLEPDRQRALAADLFNYVWTLMETEKRTVRQTELPRTHPGSPGRRSASHFVWHAESGKSRAPAPSRAAQPRRWSTRRRALRSAKPTI